MPHSFCQGRLSQEMLEGEDITSVLVSYQWSLKSNAYEAYVWSVLINKDPAAIHKAYPKYRREMCAARVKYLSQNWVHQLAPAAIHHHDTVLRTFYPDQTMSMGLFIPISYLYPTAVAKMRMWVKHRKSEKGGAQMAEIPACSPPTILIDDIEYLVHQDAMDMILDDSVYSLSHVNTRHTLCIANKKNRGQRRASATKQNVSRTIKWRISPRWHECKCKMQKASRFEPGVVATPP